MITLVKLTSKNFGAYRKFSIQHFAVAVSKARNINQAEGRRLAKKSFNSIFSKGEKKDQYVYRAMNGRMCVGFLHIGIRRDRPKPYLYIWDIFINPKHRRKGFGKEVLALAEVKARELGIHKILLNVFGFNKPAIQLYKGTGYRAESSIMA